MTADPTGMDPPLLARYRALRAEAERLQADLDNVVGTDDPELFEAVASRAIRAGKELRAFVTQVAREMRRRPVGRPN